MHRRQEGKRLGEKDRWYRLREGRQATARDAASSISDSAGDAGCPQKHWQLEAWQYGYAVHKTSTLTFVLRRGGVVLVDTAQMKGWHANTGMK